MKTKMTGCSLAIVLALCLLVKPAHADEGGTPKGKYIAGGIVGTAVGFGIGHAIVGEYGSIGWVFTLTESASFLAILVGYGLIVADAVDCVDSYSSTCSESTPAAGLALVYGGALAMSGFHVWEVIDIWTRPLPVVGANEPATEPAVRLAIVPTAMPRGGAGLALAAVF